MSSKLRTFLQKLQLFKVIDHVFKITYFFAKITTFQSHRPCLQNYVLSKLRIFSKISTFQNYVFSKLRIFKFTYFQITHFQIRALSKVRTFKNTYFLQNSVFLKKFPRKIPHSKVHLEFPRKIPCF